MKKSFLFMGLALALALVVIIYLWPGPESVGPCIVTGDVHNNISLADLPNKYYVKIPGGGRGIPLVKLLEAAQPLSSEYSILLMGDSLFAEFKGDELGGCYIVKKDGGWSTVAKRHPPGAEINNLCRIVIADETADLALGVNVITQTENLLHITPGNMFRRQLLCYPYIQRESEHKDGYAFSLFEQKQVLPLSSMTDEEIHAVLVMGKNGEYERFDGAGYLELCNNEINYLQPGNQTTIRNIAGAIINPPALSVMDAHTDSLYYLNKDERVMVILIEGLNYSQYEVARKKGLVANLTAVGSAIRVNTIYKPVANAALAAIVTGQPPAINGIIDCSLQQPKIKTIFDWLEEENKTHILVEGDTSILTLNTKTIYSPDFYKDGNTDDDVFGNALNQIQNQPDFLLVHFHGVKAAGLDFGPLDAKTLAVLEKVDAYVGLLLKEWAGKVIVVAGHGMPAADSADDCGCFSYEEMFVPYIID